MRNLNFLFILPFYYCDQSDNITDGKTSNLLKLLLAALSLSLSTVFVLKYFRRWLVSCITVTFSDLYKFNAIWVRRWNTDISNISSMSCFSTSGPLDSWLFLGSKTYVKLFVLVNHKEHGMLFSDLVSFKRTRRLHSKRDHVNVLVCLRTTVLLLSPIFFTHLPFTEADGCTLWVWICLSFFFL